MDSSPLIITQEVLQALHDLRDEALKPENKVDMQVLAKTIRTPEGKREHMAQMSAQSVIIPGPWEFCVTFSIESNHPSGTMRHMSMSIDRENRVPSMMAVWMVAEELGFKGALEECVIWPEQLLQGKAINVVQPLEN